MENDRTVNLDDQQKAAIHTESRKALCIAGAGSGKTRVIIERIAYLIEKKKVSPYEILALTFTRKAAGELRQRIEERVEKRAYHIEIGTIHAVGLKLLHRFGDLVGLRPHNITVYGGWEEDYLIREIAVDLGMIKGKSWKIPKKTVYAMLNDYYSKGVEPNEDHLAYSLFHELLTRCRENNAVTYGMILTSLMTLVPKIRQYLKWRHIFLDEAQDTDPLQWWIVETFPNLLNASLFAVGDIDQSIYRFRGAVPEYLVEKQHEFDIYRIESNYRSMPEIVKCSNKLIENNVQRIPKTMRATREDIGIPSITVERDFDSETIADYIRRTLEQGVRPDDIVVLSRIHVLLEKLSQELTEFMIPHIKIGRKTELVNSESFRRFHAFLKLMINSYDNFAFLLIKDLVRISKDYYAEIRLKASQECKSHFQIWLDTSIKNKVLYYFKADKSSALYPAEIWKNCLEEIGFPFSDAFNFIREWQEENQGTLADYLKWLSTYDIQDEIEEESSKLQLMTIHAAKGLEFPAVIIIGCNEGILPSRQSIASENIEEERRLMYVALTRAKDIAVLAVRPESKQRANGQIDENPQSRFIGEIRKT